MPRDVSSVMKKIEQFRGRRVVVVGDLMLDEFVRGDVARISPEAPVPILEVKERTAMPGGAANAAANVASLGGSASLVGCVGADLPGETTRRLVEASGIDAAGFVVDASRPTTVKTRIVARNQQVVRIDHETRGAFGPAIGEAIATAVRAAVASADACVVSDYGKGIVTPELVRVVVQAAAGKPVIVDPKRRDFGAYAGATVITPNLGELEVAVGRTCASVEDIVEAAQSVLPQLAGGAVLVTRGPGGMSLVEPGKPAAHVPARARAVFDVTGAGDTVVGTLALALAVGLPMLDAIDVASAAAAIAVSKPGTATVTIDELRAELRGHDA
ncbi:MAG TPA: D-glycero-beta-D-manno-heptose-7-phosphate kinase [Gaiellaceae bacterium]|nr:D-glycero-beta-D-manno-heptose-7-phosphate kinase [Gaiellaceae bacterium]